MEQGFVGDSVRAQTEWAIFGLIPASHIWKIFRSRSSRASMSVIFQPSLHSRWKTIRLIPTSGLHFDHIIPYSNGDSSTDPAKIRQHAAILRGTWGSGWDSQYLRWFLCPPCAPVKWDRWDN